MSFGFSVGDFLAAGRLVHEVIQSLQELGGAKSDYQELIRELSTLKKALQHLDSMQSDSSSDDRTLQSIKFAALSCRQPLEQFLAQANKYKKSLDVWAKNRASNALAHKLRWGFGMKGEVSKLQGYLNLHVATINMLLAEHGLEKLNLAQEKADSRDLQIREKLDLAQALIERIGNSVSGQAALIQNTSSMIKSLMDMVCGEFRTTWRSLGEMVANICVSTQQIYTVVLDIKSSIGTVDTRFTFFQVPLLLEDALGFKFPVPSEWDYGMLENHIHYRFREGIGSQDVKAGNWELFKTKNSNDTILPHSRLLPGLEITMAIILSTPILSDERCPITKCQSDKTTVAPAGGRICCECGTWFTQATKKRNGLDILVEAIDSGLAPSPESAPDRKSRARSAPSERSHTGLKSTEEQCPLRNVRWTVEEASDNSVKETGSSLESDKDSERQLREEMETTRNVDDATPEWDQDTAYDSWSHRSNVLGISINRSSSEDEGSPGPTEATNDDEQEDTYSENAVTFDHALNYVNRVKKAAIAHDSELYRSFLTLLKDYQSGILDTSEVAERVSALFSELPELLDGFKTFLPERFEIDSTGSLALVPVVEEIQSPEPEDTIYSLKRKRRTESLKGDWEYIPVDDISSPEPKKLRHQ
jgi:hypothetical protein